MKPVRFRLPAYFQDGMVLQQGISNRVFGLTKANAELKVKLERFPAQLKAEGKKQNLTSQKKETKTKAEFGLIYAHTMTSDSRGVFDFNLPALEASKDHYRLSLTVENQSCIFKDIYFGEVWLALGEANMSMPVKYSNLKNHIDTYTNNPFLRFFTMDRDGVSNKNEDYKDKPTAKISGGKWQKVDQDSVDELSATALAFSARLAKYLNVPVAIYDLASPNTMIQSWLSKEAILENDKIFNHVQKVTQEQGQLLKKNQPSVMYNHKLAPFLGLSIRGLILSHGESDLAYPKYYLHAFKAFSNILKESFHSFKRGPYLIYSQLTSHLYNPGDDKALPYFNEILSLARRRLALNAGLVTVYDLPLDYIKDQDHEYAHPMFPVAKEQIGERMYLLAKGLAYQANLPKSAPEIKYAEWIANKLILSFANVGEGLTIPENDASLKGFYISSENMPYLSAEANKLYGIRAMVWHNEVKEPNACTYAFTSFNQSSNLKGTNNIPVVPFRLSKEKPRISLNNDWMTCDRLSSWVVPSTLPYRFDLPDDQKAGNFPLWKISGAKATLELEKDNKITGTSSILLKFSKNQKETIILEPILTYASLFPPLDLHYWKMMTIELFNADHKTKTLALKITDMDNQSACTQKSLIEDILAWQIHSFDLQDLDVNLKRIKQIQFIFDSHETTGEITIDSIKCKGIIEIE